MKGTSQVICLCLLVALMTESSMGFLRYKIRFPSRRAQRFKCPKGFGRLFAGKRCRKPLIPMAPITKTPTTVPTTKATTQSPEFLFSAQQNHSSGLPYCKSRDVNAILSGRTKRAVTHWPYECKYASILMHEGSHQFIFPIFDCCNKCSFPTFTSCVAKSSSAPEWKCPSEGLHCIVDCVNKHNPAKSLTPGILPNLVVQPVAPLKPLGGDDGDIASVKPVKPVKPVPTLTSCEKLETDKNGKQCVRKLCIPLKLKRK